MATGEMQGMDEINPERDRDHVNAVLHRHVGKEVSHQHKTDGHVIDTAIGLIGAATTTQRTKGAFGGNTLAEDSFQKGNLLGFKISTDPSYSFFWSRACSYRPSGRDVQDDPSIHASNYTEYRRLKRQRMAELNEWLIWGRSPSPIHEPLLDKDEKPASEQRIEEDAQPKEIDPAEAELDKEELRLFMYAPTMHFARSCICWCSLSMPCLSSTCILIS